MRFCESFTNFPIWASVKCRRSEFPFPASDKVFRNWLIYRFKSIKLISKPKSQFQSDHDLTDVLQFIQDHTGALYLASIRCSLPSI